MGRMLGLTNLYILNQFDYHYLIKSEFLYEWAGLGWVKWIFDPTCYKNNMAQPNPTL